MYKYFMATVLFVVFVLFLEPAEKVLSNFLRLDKPIMHQIEEGDWFSKIAQRYYGDPSYAKELALVNRAPNGDLIFPGEKIIIPSFEKIQKIRHTRKLSIVNNLVREQQEMLLSQASEPVSEMSKTEAAVKNSSDGEQQSNAEDVESVGKVSRLEDEIAASDERSSFNLPMLLGLILLGAAVAGGIVFYIRKKKQEEVSFYGASEEKEEPEKSVYYDDFDFEKKDKSESSRKEKAEVV